ncbi:MAG: hypothetical protein EBT70_16000, partial [Betaproteobacteria bacterium]|nr:hypothetical protein [Betaproteobacteria bacterium]
MGRARTLLWRPEFEVGQQRMARVHGWHRALQMWSRINRGTPQRPGLVFALLRGGSCWGMVQQVPSNQAHEVLERLWFREMPMGVYEPRWLRCQTEVGDGQVLEPAGVAVLGEHELALARGEADLLGELALGEGGLPLVGLGVDAGAGLAVQEVLDLAVLHDDAAMVPLADRLEDLVLGGVDQVVDAAGVVRAAALAVGVLVVVDHLVLDAEP